MLQTRRHFLTNTAMAMAAASLKGADSGKPPNFVMIFLDDSGWADFHPFGNPAYQTPNVERLAGQGCQFHNFYVTQAICSASRSSLLSGCYPGRTKVFGAHRPAGPRARSQVRHRGPGAQGRRIPHRGFRQVAHRRSAGHAPAGPRLRRIVRADVLERHVGVPSQRTPRTTASIRCSSGITAR